jgi:hypothetical protein
MSDVCEPEQDNVIFLDSVVPSLRDESAYSNMPPSLKYNAGCVDVGRLNGHAINLTAPYRKRNPPEYVATSFPPAYLREVEKMVRELVHGVHSLEAKPDGMVVLATKDAWDCKYCFIFWLDLAHFTP